MTERQLPSWMTKKNEKAKEKSGKRQRAARSVFYCMNETELVEAAVSYLTREDATLLGGQKVTEEEGDSKMGRKRSTAAAPAMEVLEERRLDSGDAQNTTYVSETDLDITEVETVPYTRSPLRAEGQGSGPVQDHSGVIHADLETEIKGRPSAEEDDAFQLVREIFFT